MNTFCSGLQKHLGSIPSAALSSSSIIYVKPVEWCYKCFDCSEVAICFPLAVWSVLCICGFLTSLFGLLPLSCWLALSDLWQSGANGTEPGFVSVVLWLDRCRLIGPLTSFSVSFSLSLPLDEVSVKVRWPASEAAADQHPQHLDSFIFTPPSCSDSSLCQRDRAAGERGSRLTFRQGHET